MLAQRLLRRPDGHGRALALEVLVGTPAVAALVREKKTFQLPSILQTGKKEGMQTMDDALMQLVREGAVSPHEAAQHASNSEVAQQFERRDSGVMRREAA